MEQSSSQAQAAPQMASWAALFRGRQALITVTVNVGIMLFAMDTLIVATIMPAVVRDIGGAPFYSWTVMLYMVGSIVGAAGSAPMRGVFGRRNGYILAGAVFVGGLVGAAVAPSMLILALWRLVQGLGGGMIMSMTYGLVSDKDLFAPELRTRALAAISTTWGVATVIGPAVGAGFGEWLTWRAAFGGLVPLGVLFILFSWRLIANVPGHGSMQGFPFGRLSLLAASVMSIGISQQAEAAWAQAALFALAVPLFALAIRLDRGAASPMMPSRPFMLSGAVGACYWVVMLQTVAFTAINLYATLNVQIIHGLDPISAGYIYAILSFCWTGGALLVAGWRGAFVWVAIWGGLGMIVAGIAAVAVFAVPGPVWAIGAAMGLIGLGIGATNNHLLTLTLASAVHGEESITAVSYQTVRMLGVAFGSAAAGLVANAAGLGTGVTVDTVTAAVNWIYGLDVAIAVLMTAAALPFFIHVRRPAADQPLSGR
jgi:MFS family permease